MDRILELIAGITGTGKSYFVKNKFLPQMDNGKKPVIIFDRMGEYAGKTAKDVPKKWANYNGYEDFLDSILENDGYLKNEIHVIQCEKDSDYTTVINIFHKLKKPVSLVIDEAHDLFSAPEFKPVARKIINVCRYGRKFKMDLVLITQRTLDVPPDVRSQFQGNVISFKQSLQNDVEALEKMGCEGANKVLDLDKRNYHVFGELPKRIKI